VSEIPSCGIYHLRVKGKSEAIMDEAKTRILLVDDEKSILETAEEYFHYVGYEVFTARNGLEAVDLLEKQAIDCCITDINMPEMDGLQLAEHLRRLDNTIPVIIMTGYPSFENTLDTLKNGVVDFMIKPVNLQQMEVSVRKVMAERKLFVENFLLKNEVKGKKRLERLNIELVERIEELQHLNQIMQGLSPMVSTSDVFRKTVDLISEISGCHVARFFLLYEGMPGPVEMAISHAAAETGTGGEESETLGQTNLPPIGERIILDVAKSGVPIFVPENRQIEGLSTATGSAMLVPLKIRNQVFGVLTAQTIGEGRRFTEKDLYYVSFVSQQAAGVLENLALYENIYENLFDTLYAFVRAIGARDSYTEVHSRRVAKIAAAIGKQMGCSKEDLDVLNFAGHLHDIGKIGIPDEILNKPSELTDAEFAKIREHPVIGAGIFERLGLWEKEKEIIRWHHERYDGSGYPDGLKRDAIPRLARILSVADAIDTMTSNRTYRKKLADRKVIGAIRDGAGSQFDPEVVHAFLGALDRGDLILPSD
jgi:putative nucleotidyltransferase with HDIG domain